MEHYICHVHRDAAGHIGLTCDDLPGFAVQIDGDDISALIKEATKVLAVWVEEMRRAKQPVPAASTTMPSGDGMFVTIPAMISAGNVTRINVSMPEGVIDMIDQKADARGQTRSAFLATAALLA